MFTFLTGEQEILGSDLREGVLILRAAYPNLVVATLGCRARSGRWLRPQPQEVEVWLTLHHACYFKVRPHTGARCSEKASFEAPKRRSAMRLVCGYAGRSRLPIPTTIKRRNPSSKCVGHTPALSIIGGWTRLHPTLGFYWSDERDN